jgi:Uma2 family endonuclease
MTQTFIKPLSYAEFIERYPEDGGRYELINGEIVLVRPLGSHEKVAALISRKLDVEIERLSLPYFIPRTCLVKPNREGDGYLPDIIVLDEKAVEEDPYWRDYSSISLGRSACLIVEIVSTNWQDDYLRKLAEYEILGIPEYWIVDYRALGGVRYLGSPKQPTIWLYYLLEGEYQQLRQFRGDERIESPTFSELDLSAQEIFAAGS